MTMLELLIVVAVMVILMGLALPMMKTGIEERRLREAARQVNTGVELAKALAIETGRYAGLVIDTEWLPEDLSQEFPFARRLYLAETPPPYAGDVTGARAYVSGSQVTFNHAASGTYPAESLSIGSLGIRHGDLIKFDYKGPLFQIVDGDLTTPYAINSPSDLIAIVGSPLPPTGSYPYQIFRKPEKSSSMPLELPLGAVIDLTNSGFGLNRPYTDLIRLRAATGPVTVIFDPSGRMLGVTGIDLSDPPTEKLHLLIGEVDKLAAPGEDSPLWSVAYSGVPSQAVTFNENLESNASLWVSIGHYVGRVSTAENAWVVTAVPPASFDEGLQLAREFAQSGQSMGGR
jgi:type II secretory pathway pseudopilin PulG